MLPYWYRTFQDTIEDDLEVIGGAGVGAGDGKVKSEIRKKRASDRRSESNP
jgi:hypothetical protein